MRRCREKCQHTEAGKMYSCSYNWGLSLWEEGQQRRVARPGWCGRWAEGRLQQSRWDLDPVVGARVEAEQKEGKQRESRL